jgi:hypothetical protein
MIINNIAVTKLTFKFVTLPQKFVTAPFFRNICLLLGFFLTIVYMPKNVNKAGQTHDQLQAACYKWACQTYHPYVYRRLICVPNDLHKGNIVRAKQYQALGLTRGAWDMPFFWVSTFPDARFNLRGEMIIPWTYWWEFKVGSDDLSDYQINFAETNSFGHTFNVASEESEFQLQFNSIVLPTIEFAKKIFTGA